MNANHILYRLVFRVREEYAKLKRYACVTAIEFWQADKIATAKMRSLLGGTPVYIATFHSENVRQN